MNPFTGLGRLVSRPLFARDMPAGGFNRKSRKTGTSIPVDRFKSPGALLPLCQQSVQTVSKRNSKKVFQAETTIAASAQWIA
jgi:hypothetical protein